MKMSKRNKNVSKSLRSISFDFAELEKELAGLEFTAEDIRQFEELEKEMSEFELYLYDSDLDFLLQ